MSFIFSWIILIELELDSPCLWGEEFEANLG